MLSRTPYKIYSRYKKLNIRGPLTFQNKNPRLEGLGFRGILATIRLGTPPKKENNHHYITLIRKNMYIYIFFFLGGGVLKQWALTFQPLVQVFGFCGNETNFSVLSEFGFL